MKKIFLGRLGKRILLWFVTISFIPMVIVGLIGYIYVRMSISKDVIPALSETTARVKENLLRLIEEKKNRTINLASDPDGFIKDCLEKLYSGKGGDKKIAKDLSSYLDIGAYPLTSYCFERFIIDVQGKVVASSNRRLLGKNMQGSDYFLEAVKLPHGAAYISDVYNASEEDIEKRDSFYVSSPIVSFAPKALLGVLVNRCDISEVTEIAKGKWQRSSGGRGAQLLRIGETGEVYIVNKDKLMLTSSRADEYSPFTVLSQIVDTEPVRTALLRREEESGVYRNYRGVNVFGVSGLIKETKWIILTEMELKEAYSPLAAPRNIIIIIILISVIAIVLIGLFVTGTLVQPIMLLKEGAGMIGGGNLSHRIILKTNDEIQDVAEAFNDMASELKEIYDNLQMSIYESRKHAMELAQESKELEKVNMILKSDRTAMMNIMEDMDDTNRRLKDAQAQLLQSEKMAVVGQLAAGVAHEINNPMSFIISNLDTISKYIPDIADVIKNKRSGTDVDIDFLLEDAAKIISESYEGALRVKRIVQDLKTFSHVDEAEMQLTDVHTCLDSTLNILANELKYKAKIIKEYGSVPNIWCYPMQLNQVLLNLIVNASQAIEKDGTILLKTYSDQRRLFIEIADNGCGIQPEIVDKIFEPFFTTKGVGKGTGLGLSIAYNIINKHNGEIKVKSEVGKGSVFTIILPLSGLKTQNDIVVQ